MKTMILILPIFFLITGCGEEEPKQQLDTNSIYGTWQLVEQYYFNYGYLEKDTWTKVLNGETIVFYKNDLFFSSRADTCSINPLTSGRFRMGTADNYNFIEMSLSCTEDIFNIKDIYTFENNYLILSPIDVCDEGCAFKYKKIADPKEGD